MVERPTLSAAIITYNEEENIERCLASVMNFVDEIIVLDSYSTDNTEAICRRHPKVNFKQHHFDGHIQQKNRAIELCSSEWVLSLDADEEVGPRLRSSILDFLAKHPDVAGAKFPRLTRHMQRDIRHGGWYPNSRYRLFRRGQAHWGGQNPHDKLILKGKGVELEGDLIHFSAKDLSDQVKTINSFSSIVAYERHNDGKGFSLWRLLLKPLSKFIELYLLKRGLLDGMQGFIIAVSSAYSAFLKEAKLFELSVLNLEKPSNLPAHYR